MSSFSGRALERGVRFGLEAGGTTGRSWISWKKLEQKKREPLLSEGGSSEV